MLSYFIRLTGKWKSVPLQTVRHDRELWPIPLLLQKIPQALKSPHTCPRLKPVKPTRSHYMQVVFTFTECEPIFTTTFSPFRIMHELSLRSQSFLSLSASLAMNPNDHLTVCMHCEINDHTHTSSHRYILFPQWYTFYTLIITFIDLEM